MSDEATRKIRALLVELAPPKFSPSRLDQATRAVAILVSNRLESDSNDRDPRFLQDATPKQAVKELLRFHKALEALDVAATGLSSPAFSAFEIARVRLTGNATPGMGSLLIYLKDRYPELSEAARSAIRKLQDDDTGHRSGRPRKTSAYLLAYHLAEIYEYLTGQPPTISVKASEGLVSGRFFEFVRKVFALTNIDGSPETFARQAVKARRPSAAKDRPDWLIRAMEEML